LAARDKTGFQGYYQDKAKQQRRVLPEEYFPDETQYRRGMVVTAHADDAEFSCSGTVAKWCAEGWDVVYVICTDGSKGSEDKDMTSEQLVKAREDEQLKAGKVLGLKEVAFLGYPDGYLEPTLNLRRDIAREIRKHKPDVMICLNPVRDLNVFHGVNHPDHIASGEAALSAAFPAARDHLTFPELHKDEGLEPHKTAEAWVVGTGEPDFFSDVTDHVEIAIRALLEHGSQLGDFDSKELGDRMKEWRLESAVGTGMKYAEAFKRIRFRL